MKRKEEGERRKKKEKAKKKKKEKKRYLLELKGGCNPTETSAILSIYEEAIVAAQVQIVGLARMLTAHTHTH